MHNNKKGFTLAEVLLTLLIIGVIMAMSVPVIISVKGAYTKSTYYVFNSMEAAITKIMAGSAHPYLVDGTITYGFDSTDVRAPHIEDNVTHARRPYYFANSVEYGGITIPRNILFTCKSNSGQTLSLIRGVEIPPAREFGVGASNGCSSLQTAADAQSPIFCEAFAALSNTGKTWSKIEADGSVRTHGAVNCSDLKTVDTSGAEPMIAEYGEPNFTSNNGYSYYISRWTKMTGTDDYGYRLIAVDLNGRRRMPNVDNPNSTKLPDIVTFLVWDTGTIYPLGVAADDFISSDKKHRARYLPSDAKGYIYAAQNPNTPDIDKIVPRECNIQGSNEKWVGKLAPAGCSYGVIKIEDSVVPSSEESDFYKMTYREAYCTVNALRENSTDIYHYPDSFVGKYCSSVTFASGYEQNDCPVAGGLGGGVYDKCTVDPIKPAFKFNLD